MKVSDWIHAYHSVGEITGFITEMSSDMLTVFVTIPSGIGEIQIKRASAWLAEKHIQMQDIPSLLDLSLLTKDKEWFEELRTDLSMREQWVRYHAMT